MRLVHRLALVALVMLAACKVGDDILTDRPFGLVTVAVDSTGPGAYVTSPTAYFFNAVNVFLPPSSSSVTDTCVVRSFPIDTLPSGNLEQLFAGPSLTFTTDAGTAQMDTTRDPDGLLFYGILQSPGRIAITPGQHVSIDVPGDPNGFSPFHAESPTLGPLHIDPVSTTGDGPLTVTWNAGPSGSALIMQLEYASTSAGTEPDQMLRCSFVDSKGTADIPENLAALWRSAPAGTRHIDAFHYLTTFITQGNNQMMIISRFDTQQAVE